MLMQPGQWLKHVTAVNSYKDDAFQQPIIWKQALVTKDIHGEDKNVRYKEVIIKGLVQYNYFRAWPITQTTDSGEIDKENCLVYLNTSHLKEKGFTNDMDQFDFQPDFDRFVINGKEYKAMGESQAAQAHDKTLFTFIILKREEIGTGQELY